MLKSKLLDIFTYMGIDLKAICLDNIPRLPALSSPRPVIVKFVSLLDRQTVWNNKHYLRHHTHQNLHYRTFCPDNRADY